ncbi:Gfo/Idh/MocA family protein [Microbacterium sp. A588]
MRSKKVAVIGGGGIGSIHAAAYQAVGAELVGVIEPSEAIAAQFSARFGVPSFPTLDALLAASLGTEVVSICTPPVAHRELTEQAIAAGLHVLCEKPLAHTLEDATAIHEAATRAGVVVGTAYCHRFQPELQFMKTMIEEGRIGNVRTFSNEFSGHQDDIEKRWFGRKALSGGGAVLDAAIHSIDVFRFLCGEIDQASGSVVCDLDGTVLEVEHSAALAVRSIDAVVGTILVSWKAPSGKTQITLAGSTGGLTYDYARPGEVEHVTADGVVHVLEVPVGNRFEREIDDFLEAAHNGSAPRTSTFDGLVGVGIVDAVYRGVPIPDFSSLRSAR